MTTPVEIVRFYVPSSATEPMDVMVDHSGLRMVLVNRESIKLLDEKWRVRGLYFLLGSADDPDRFKAYVGEVGTSTLIQRLRNHAVKKEWWSRALLIASASDQFNSAEIGWLEGRLYDVLNNAVAAEVMNGNRPGDDSLPARERGVLERYVAPVMAALRACGAPPDTADQKPPPKGTKPKYYSETVADLIGAGLLKPGTQLVPLRKNLTTVATVLPDGQLRVAGDQYGSLSAAAKAVSGKVAEAGWDFWGSPSGEGGYVPLATLRSRLRRGKTASEAIFNAPEKPAPTTAGVPKETSAARPNVGRRSPRRFSGTVAQLIEKGLLQPGTVLRPARRSLDKTATVDASGSINVDGVSHSTPSGAAKAASGQKAEPGWDFWVVDDEQGGTLAARRAKLISS
jgi:hypothetical protein